MFYKPIIFGLTGTTFLLLIYFSIVSLISGWSFALDQFGEFWYFIVSLAIGFGIQIGLYVYLKNAIRRKSGSAGVLAVSGTTSTVAMLSCCAHYLVNILPILGITGVLSLIGQYQTELFWIGLAFNLAGIAFITRKIILFKRV
jgi:Cu+-exporting ATPase